MTPGSLLLGCIADDLTGATDLANTLARRGMTVVQTIGVPKASLRIPAAEAIVVALKSRTIPAAESVTQSLAACRWLKGAGARQFYFKYCSTFDSTDAGNIGPVADALLGELGANFTIACPAFPEAGRSIYMGHLFVGRQLLSESAMRNHPLTPMQDSDLVRVLGRQTRAKVGLVPLATVRRGPAAIRAAFAELAQKKMTYAIVDALEDADLLALGEACDELTLITGGSGAATGLPANYRRARLIPDRQGVEGLAPVGGLAAVLAGSCSPATLGQIEAMRASHAARQVDPIPLARDSGAEIAAALDWARERLPAGPILIHASAPPELVAAAQAALGRESAGALIEAAMAAIAIGLVAAGVRRLVVAGGETSGAVVQGLGITALQIGPQIDPGVPATRSIGEPAMAMALKSGNFGGPGFFAKALEALR